MITGMADDITVAQMIERIRARIRRGEGRHSQLWWFLRDQHDEIAAHIAAHGTDWKAMAEELATRGVTNRASEAASPRMVSQTWRRVTKRVQAERAKGKPQPALTLVPNESAQGVTPLRPAEPSPPAASSHETNSQAEDDPLARVMGVLAKDSAWAKGPA